jgi:hypothetical protein
MKNPKAELEDKFCPICMNQSKKAKAGPIPTKTGRKLGAVGAPKTQEVSAF